MTDAQLYVAMGVPIFAILTSLTVSMIQISGIRGDMRELRADFRGLRSDVTEEIRSLRADLNTLTGKVFEIDTRLTRIEERLERR